MTKKEMFNLIATVNADNDAIVEFCNHEIEMLSRKSTKQTMSAKQKENVAVKDVILEALKAFADGVTLTDLQRSCEALAGLSNQKMSALANQMVRDGIVDKWKDKKTTLFKAVVVEG